MNHFYHTLNPLVALAAFVLLLLTFLSPTTIFADRVSLLHVNTTTASTTATTSSSSAVATITRRAVAARDLHRFEKRAKVNATSKAAAAASATFTSSLDLFYGPMGEWHEVENLLRLRSFGLTSLAGACVRSTKAGASSISCSAPSFTPIFLPLYTSVDVPAAVQADLPDQFPLAPTALFLCLLLSGCALVAIFLSSVGNHAPKGVFARKAGTWRRLALWSTVAALVVGLASTVALRKQLGDVVKSLSAVDAGGASLGTGFTRTSSLVEPSSRPF